MNIENLTMLQDYLLRRRLRARFNMRLYSETAISHKNCGTIGCAIGHGPYAGIPNSFDEGWMTYSDRVFDLSANQWTWCFSTAWAQFDNTPKGAAHRISYLIEHGEPPKEWVFPNYKRGWWRRKEYAR